MDEQEGFSYVEVDIEQLDKEWVEQPTRFHKAAKKVADARHELAKAKAALEIIEAEVALDIRNNPTTFGLKKPTETAVKNMVVVDKRTQTAVKTLNKAKHKVDVFEARVSALEHKKRALENLVSLHQSDYFSAPRARGVTSEVREEVDRKKKKAIRTMGGKKRE